MPTEHEYRAAAHDLRVLARGHRDAIAWAPRRPATGFTGDGPVADAIDTGFDRALRWLSDAADQIDRAASECERRADVCRAHRHDLARWDELPLHIRERVPVPARPAPWVDAR